MTRKRIKKVPVLDMFGGIYGYSAPEKEISIVVCDKSQADAIIVPHHYSHKVTKNSFLSFLVYYKGKINGAMQIGYGIRPKIKKIGGAVKMIPIPHVNLIECGYQTICLNSVKLSPYHSCITSYVRCIPKSKR